jgi:DNA-directed RNA polymerase alpha subunit
MPELAEIREEALAALKVASNERHAISNLEQLGIGQRLINLFQSNGINDMRDLLLRKKEDLMSMNNFGNRQMEVLFSALSKYHYVED